MWKRNPFVSLHDLFTNKSGFESSKLGFQIPCIRNVMFNISITIFIYFISILVRGTQDLERVSVLLCNFIFTVAIFVLTYKKFFHRFAQLTFTLYVIVLLISLFELSLKYFITQSKKEVFMGGFLATYVVALVVTARLNWIFISLVLLLESIFISFRINKDDSEAGETSLTLEIPIICFFVSLFFTQIVYSLQASELRVFEEIQKKSKSLESFKNLINYSLPDQIIVLPRDAFTSRKILFLNKSARSFFKTDVESTIVSYLEKIYFEGYTGVRLNLGEDEIVTIRDYIEKDCGELEYLNFVGRLSSQPPRRFGNKHLSNNTKPYFNFQSSLQNFNLPPSNTIRLTPTENNHQYSTVAQNLRDEEEDDRENELLSIKLGRLEWEQGEHATVIILSEISNQQKILQLEELHSYKDQMLANVSHDMRTPLNGIIGLIQYVMEEINEPKIIKVLRHAANSANFLLFMINDLLDMSQINKGKLSLNITTLGVEELVDPVIKLIEYSIKKKNLEFIIENKTRPEVLVNVDSNRFQQILMNLLGNALKFTSKGSIKLQVYEDFVFTSSGIIEVYNTNDSPRRLPESNKILESMVEVQVEEIPACKSRNTDDKISRNMQQCVVFSVEDSGIGIKDEDQGLLFKPFGKLKNKDNPNGVGLGLAISQNLVRLMAPNISSGIQVSSEFGKGSKFWFALETAKKLGLDENENVNRNEILGKISIRNFEREFLTKERRRKRNVLVVDDDQINLLVVKNFLKGFGSFELSTACNGLEALNVIQSSHENGDHFDLIFMDCNMPVMNGFDSVKRINEMVSENIIPKPKIYALTGYNSENEATKCNHLGIKMLAKPLNREKFNNIIQALL